MSYFSFRLFLLRQKIIEKNQRFCPLAFLLRNWLYCRVVGFSLSFEIRSIERKRDGYLGVLQRETLEFLGMAWL